MLRINHRGGAASASYYTKVISQSYYGQENPGFWHGLSAQMLGYQDGQQIEPDDFVKLCHSIDPNTDQRLNIRQPKRATYDFTFSAPKSVSVEAALGGDKGTAIQEAFRESVIETMREAEQQMATRVRTTPGSDENRTTGNMIWGEFLETTTRPVDGIPDPHLHIHAVAISTTWDAVEGRRKAAQFGDIKRDAPYYQAVVDARLADKLTNDLGYEIRRSTRQVGNRMVQGWELAHVPDSVMQTFSRRTKEIEQMAIDQGYMTEGGIVLNPEGMAKLGETTREHKVVLHPDQLLPTWESWLLDSEKAAMDNRTLQSQTNTPGVTRSLDYALEHLFQNNSTTTERQLITHALTYGIGSVTPEEIQNQIQQRDDILTKERDGKTWLTTQEAWDEEREMISLARLGRGTRPALNLADAQHEFKPIVNDDGTTFELNAQQQAAVRHIWQSNDFVTSIRGGAGVGKTTLLQEAVAGINAGGHKVFTFAPSSDAVKVLQEEGFHNADTVQQLMLKNPRQQQEFKNSVLLIDETGLMGSRQMNKVFKMADELDAWVILSGDSKQHRAVERGDALRILENSAGITSAEVTEITRQSGAYKKAVEAIGSGDVKEGFKRLDRMGAIKEITDGSKHEQFTTDYLNATRRNWFGKRYTALGIAPTHAEGDSATSRIRDRFKGLKKYDSRKLGDKEHSFTQLRNQSYTEAERGDPFNYAPGQIVQFVRRSEGIAKGERFTVVGRNSENDVVIRDQDGLTQHLALAEAEKFQVYQERTLELAENDRIRITQNGWSEEGHRLNNGDIYNVAGFTKDQEGEIAGIRLANGWAIGKEFGHLAHGYVVTSHASQGKTVDHVLIAEGAESFPAASLEQFYVSVSRGKRSVTIYTDDKEALLEAVEVSSQRLSATELMQEKQWELDQEQEKTVEQWTTLAQSHGDYLKEAWPAAYQMFAAGTPAMLPREKEPELER